MTKRLVLYPERNANGDGDTVAICYATFLQEEKILYIVRSYSKSYNIKAFDIKGTTLNIAYEDVELRRIRRRIHKKQKKGILSSNQCMKIELLFVCSMVEKKCHTIK